MGAPIPHVVGTLETTSLGELLVQALDHRLTGTLVLEEPGGARHGIYLEVGAPRRVKVAAPVAFLGDVLVESGALSLANRERALERASRERVLFGQLLVGEGLIDEHTLSLGLREHLARKVAWLFARPHATQYGYFDGANFLEAWGAPSDAAPTPLELLWRGVREHVGGTEVSLALARIGQRKLVLRSDLPADYFAFMGEERQVTRLLEQGPRRVEELSQALPDLASSIPRVVYFLVLTRSVDLGLPSAPPVGLGASLPATDASVRPPSFPEEAPPPLATAPLSATAAVPSPASPRRESPTSIPPASLRAATLREELRQRSENPPETHYDVLGIPRDATVRQIQSAFFLLSKHWHPDRLGPEANEVRSAAARVFDGIARSYRVLADPTARAAYDLELEAGAAEDAAPLVERGLSADVAFKRAESFLLRGNLAAAEREATAALRYDPARPEHIALNAWLAALKPNADERRIASELARVARSADGNPKVRWYRGLFLKRVGRHALALQEFRAVLDHDPRHIDAAREVRLYEQRLRSSPKDRPSLAPEQPGGKSSWSKLFRRRG